MAVENGTKVTMRDVTLIFRNFAGAPDRYDPQGGKRTFGVLLPGEIAQAMESDGWNVKWLEPRDDDEDQVRQPWLPCALRFDIRPPEVFLITSRGKTRLREEQVEMFDGADIVKVDLIVSASNWKTGEGPAAKAGVKAYVKSLYITIDEDELAQEYGEVPEQ